MGIILGRLILDEIQVSLSIFTISPLVVAGYANRETIRRATVAYRPELESIFQKYEASERGCRGKDSFVGYASITTELPSNEWIYHSLIFIGVSGDAFTTI